MGSIIKAPKPQMFYITWKYNIPYHIQERRYTDEKKYYRYAGKLC